MGPEDGAAAWARPSTSRATAKSRCTASFGYFYDIMKYNLPRGSFGGDYWHDCVYALDTPDFTEDHSGARCQRPLLPDGRRQRTAQ